MTEPGVRIVLLISNLEYGGAQRQVVGLANGLAALGHEPHACCLSSYMPLGRDLVDGQHRLHVVEKRGRFDWSVVPRLTRLLRAIDPDVVHCFLFDAEIAGRLAGRRHGRAAVIGSERNADYRRKWRHTAALRLTAACFDAVIANSHAGRRFQIRSLGIEPERVFVVHNGVDVDRFTPLPCSQPVMAAAECRRGDMRFASPTAQAVGHPTTAAGRPAVVGMFSSFKTQKNHSMFFRAARRLLDAGLNVKFTCVGAELHNGLEASDDYRRRTTAEVGALGLDEHVEFLGNRDDVVELYRACDVTALTSRREGTPNVLLESMACGVPVVATDVADNARIVPDGEAGFLVPIDDDAALAERIGRLLRDEALRRRMGAAAREWVTAEFSMEAMVRKTLAVYGRVTSNE